MNDHFSQQAEFYARYRPTYPAAMYDFIFSHLKRRQRAWDCGTGSGQVAAYLAGVFDEVCASDISDQQLSFAPREDNIKYFNVPAEDSGFPSDYFDLITVAQAIHWFDFEHFYSEVRRTAADHALLAVIGYGYVRVDQHIDPFIDRFYRDMFGTYFSKCRSWLDERYQTIPFPFDEIPSPAFEVSFEWKRKDLEGYFNSWSSVQQFKKDKSVNPADDIMEELKPLWPASEIKEVTFPVFMRLGSV